MEKEIIISVDDIHKSFGKVSALNGVSFEVEKGTILGLLGPNGAGKTTLVRILTTLLRPDKGIAKISGIEVTKNPSLVRGLIGLAGQFAAIDENLTGRENLKLIGTLYHLPFNIVKERTEKLLKNFSLEDAANRLARTYSGGMRRRLDIAASLIGEPEVLFLDEPTTGLDPKSRLELWDVIEQLVKEGTTVLLTTQYLEEADYLADNIVIIDQGKIVAKGTPKELKSKISNSVLELHLADKNKVADVASLLANFHPNVDQSLGIITMPVPIKEGAKTLVEVTRKVDEAGIEVLDVELRKPTLDEVFLSITEKK